MSSSSSSSLTNLTNSNRTIVIVGGVLSGPTAAARARETDETARILLITRDRRVSYAAAGVPYHLSGEVRSIEDLDRERKEFFESVYRIEVWTETEAHALDAARKTLRLSRRGASEQTISFDALIFALGARARVHTPRIAGVNVNGLRTLEDLDPVMDSLRAGKKRVAVIGAGLHGVAALDGLIRGGAEVTLIERDASILPTFGTQTTCMTFNELSTKARILTSTTVTEARTEGSGSTARSGAERGSVSDHQGERVTSLLLSNNEEVATDFVILTAGIVPRTELLANAGAHLAPDGSVYVTERAETSLRDVYACGICVSVPHIISGAHVWTAQGAVADKTAQVAGANAAGGSARLAPMCGSMIRRVLDLAVGRTGLSERQARAQVGASFEMTTIHASSHDAYFPGSSPVLVQLFWDRSNGKLLGAEVAGKAMGVDKRIDIAATAIIGGLTVEQLASIDLAYAPPYGSQRDPINVAATAAAAERAGLARFITPEDMHARLDHVAVLDVRSDDERRTGTIPNAMPFPLTTLRQRLSELDPKSSYVCYCDTGRRGYLAARVLFQSGFADASTLEGGLTSWKLTGLPVDRPEGV